MKKMLPVLIAIILSGCNSEFDNYMEKDISGEKISCFSLILLKDDYNKKIFYDREIKNKYKEQ